MGKYLHEFTLLISSLLVLATLVHEVSAGQYTVTNEAKNTNGGVRFDQEIGADLAIEIMGVINEFIWRLFEQYTSDDRKNVGRVINLFISQYEGFTSYTSGTDNIIISASVIANFPQGQGRARFYFSSIMYREMAHIFQWSANRAAPKGLTDGIADYVMLRSNIYIRAMYPEPVLGYRWDEGYAVTEPFLEYCEGLRPGFIVALNKKMRSAYSDDYFRELIGTPLSKLWEDYKARTFHSPV